MMRLLNILVIGALIWFFFIRQIKMAGKGALNFGKSKARLLTKERNKVTFKDVAGVEAQKARQCTPGDDAEIKRRSCVRCSSCLLHG